MARLVKKKEINHIGLQQPYYVAFKTNYYVYYYLKDNIKAVKIAIKGNYRIAKNRIIIKKTSIELNRMKHYNFRKDIQPQIVSSIWWVIYKNIKGTLV